MQGKPWVVIDTNIALDLWVFNDPRTQCLRQALHEGAVQWIATAPMREELKRVLAYTHIDLRLQRLGIELWEVLDRFDALVNLQADAPSAVYRCKDPDDQKFIDLAVQFQTSLISKDKCVLTMKNRLLRLNVSVTPEWRKVK